MHKGFEHKERYTTTSNTIKLTSDKEGKKTNGFQIDTPYKKWSVSWNIKSEHFHKQRASLQHFYDLKAINVSQMRTVEQLQLAK